MAERKRGPDGRFLAERGAPPTRGALQALQEKPVRRDGWSPARRTRFLSTLAATCNVTLACETAGMSDVGAYKLRQRDAAFRAAWRRALREGYARLESDLLQRALTGEAKLREAIGEAPSAEAAVTLIARYRPATAELLYRVHRAEALAEGGDGGDGGDGGGDDGAKAKAALIEKIMARLALARPTLIEEAR
jgi:hypothetical protein